MVRFNLNGRIEGKSDTPPKWVWVPSEQVLFCAVKVPGKRPADWQQALPFVLEEQLAQPIEQLHFVVLHRQTQGEQAGLTQVAVIDKHLMQSWVDELKVHGWGQAQLVADCFELAWPAASTTDAVMPTAESIWQVRARETADILLVRTGPFSGMAMATPIVNQLAQQQQVALQAATDAAPLTPEQLKQLSLRQGGFQTEAQRNPHWKRWSGSVLLAVLLFGLGMVQTLWQTQQALQEKDAYQKQSVQLFKTMFPEVSRIVNLRAQTKSKLGGEQAQAVQGPGQLLQRIETPLRSFMGQKQLTLGAVSWQKARLQLEVTASDTQVLDRVLKALKATDNLRVELKLKQIQATQVEASFYVQYP